MNTRDDNLLLLHYCCSGNYNLIKKFYTFDPSFSCIHSITVNQLMRQLNISQKKSEKITELIKKVKINYLKEALINKGLRYTTVFQANYPPLLKNIYDPPWVLYYVGKEDLLTSKPTLSVVGTRHPSEYASLEMKTILSPLIDLNISIVSGLALGIDGIAHELALAKQGSTIAVLGYGLDWIYPKAHTQLFHTLKEKQLIITEYPPYVRPEKWLFPERNRIISGLSEATFVVEAKERSGSLITSDLALQQGRDVFAMPGRVSDIESIGTNRLIQEGAKMILSAGDILEEYFPAKT